VAHAFVHTTTAGPVFKSKTASTKVSHFRAEVPAKPVALSGMLLHFCEIIAFASNLEELTE